MFFIFEPTPPLTNLPSEPEDILAATEKEAPKSATPEQPTPVSEVEVKPPLIANRNIILGLGIVLALGIIIGAAYGLAWFLNKSQMAPTKLKPGVSTQPSPQPSQSQTAQPEAPAQEETTQKEVSQPQTPREETKVVIDTDGDGLTDEEEAQYGTDPKKADTDGDGLFDFEEINIYKTNPLNPDTDGDSYPDGLEVRNGYNPNGPGRLVNP